VSAAAVPDLDRLLALLADRALHGLGPRDQEELRELLAAYPELDEDVLDRTAAQLDAALAPAPEDPLAPALRRELLHDLEAHWQAPAIEDGPEPAEPQPEPAREVAPVPLSLVSEAPDLEDPLPGGHEAPIAPGSAAPRPLRPVRSLRRRSRSASRPVVWIAVACLALVFIGLRLRGGGGGGLAAELERAPDALRLEWRPGAAAGPPAAGELRWSGERQLGHARLRGLVANDPSESRYQLWIVDAERGGQAVPAGLFDVPAGDEAVEVELRPALPVGEPQRFAITEEKPAGVLVSRFERTIAIARPDAPPVGPARR
jgi:hypothetical protein